MLRRHARNFYIAVTIQKVVRVLYLWSYETLCGNYKASMGSKIRAVFKVFSVCTTRSKLATK